MKISRMLLWSVPALLSLVLSTPASATLLGAGQTIPSGVNPAPDNQNAIGLNGGTLLFESTLPYTSSPAGSPFTTGTFRQAAYMTATGIDFYYQFTLATASAPAQTSSNFSFRSALGTVFTTDVGFLTTAPSANFITPDAGAVPNAATRTSNGSVISWDYTAANGGQGILIGTTTSVLVIRTNAMNFDTNGLASILAGASANIMQVLEPNDGFIPEPSTYLLMGTGLVIAGLRLRRRKA